MLRNPVNMSQPPSDRLSSVMLIVIGVAMIAVLFIPAIQRQEAWIPVSLWLVAGALIGAGILSLWHRIYGTILGAVLGLMVQYVFIVARNLF